MKAKLSPLSGKYYGTIIEVDFERNHPENKTDIRLWYCGNFEPSDRELAENNISRREWDANKFDTPREDGWGGKTDKPKDYFEICDSHFESQDCYELAKKITKFINSLTQENFNAAKNSSR